MQTQVAVFQQVRSAMDTIIVEITLMKETAVRVHINLFLPRDLSICVRPSVSLSVTLVDCDHMRGNSSKIISRMISLGT